MTIEQKPSSTELLFLNDVPDLILGGVAPKVLIELIGSGGSIMTEEYFPASNQKVQICLKDLVKCAFGTFDFSISTVELNPNYQKFIVKIDNKEQIDFTVVNATVRHGLTDALSGFLNVCPQIKTTSLSVVEVVNLFTNTQVNLKVDCHLQFGASVITLNYIQKAANGMLSIPINFKEILSSLPEGSKLAAVDVYNSGVNPFYGMRYMLTPDKPNDEWFYFENSLGGIDLICFSGSNVNKLKVATKVATRDGIAIDYEMNNEITSEKNSGYLSSKSEKNYALEFLRSKNRYHLVDGKMKRIYIVESNADFNLYELDAFKFKYKYAEEDLSLFTRSLKPLPEL